MKKILSILFGLLLPSLLFSATPIQVDDVYYCILSAGNDSYVAHVSNRTGNAQTNSSYSGDVVIPETIEYGGNVYSVTGIMSYAFANCAFVTSVSIPESVTSIGEYAFKECTSLTSIEIPNSVKEIGMQAFYYCNKLSKVSLSNSLKEIPGNCFAYCTSLIDIDVPEGITYLAYGAFSQSGIKNVQLPSTLTEIESNVFYSCSNLQHLDIPSAVSRIASEAFKSSYGISSIKFEGIAPPLIEENGLPKNIDVIVPDQSYAIYRASSYFSNTNVIKLSSTLPTCTKPVITISDDFSLSCDTEDVTYSLDQKIEYFEISSDGAKLVYNPTLYVYVYANKEGYNTSEPTILKIPITEGDLDGNGKISIADVTRLVNKLLEKKDTEE